MCLKPEPRDAVITFKKMYRTASRGSGLTHILYSVEKPLSMSMRKNPISLRERIERYVDTCEAAISGQSGSYKTFGVAVALIRGFDLSPETALPFLQRYNNRCEPVWSEKELRQKLDSATKAKADKPRGYLL